MSETGINKVCLRRTSSYATSMWAAPRALTRFSRARLFLLDHVQQRVRHAQVLYLTPRGRTNDQTRFPRGMVGGEGPTYRATTDVTLFDFPKAVALCARLVYLAERDVHKVVAVDEVSVERFSVLELDQLRRNVQVSDE